MISSERRQAGLGPVQLFAIGFGPDHRFEGRVLEELERLEHAGTIRLLDLLFVMRDAETDELVALAHEGSENLGGMVGTLLDFDFDLGGEPAPAPAPDRDEVRSMGMGRADVEELAALMGPGEATAFMLFEHVWARDLRRAIGDAGGFPLGEGFLTAEAIAFVEPELIAMAAELDALQTVSDAGATG